MIPPRRCRRAAAPPPSSDYAAGRAADEVDEQAHFRPLRGRRVEPLERLAELQVAAVDQPVRLTDRANLFLREAPALESLGVDSVRRTRITRYHHVGRHVARHNRPARQERVRANLAILVHGRQAAENDPVADLDVSAERGTVGKYRVASHGAVVRDVRVGHEEIVIADASDALVVSGAAVDRAALAKHVAVADLEPGRLAAILLVLRRIAQRGELMNPVTRPDRGRAVDDDVRPDDRAGTDTDIGADHA